MGNGSNTPMQDFHNRHSLNDKNGFVFDGNWIRYITGASRENASLGAMRPPSKDKVERLEAILRFYNVKLALASREFNIYKSGLIGLTTMSPRNRDPQLATDEAMAKLKHLQNKADALRDIVGKTEKEIELVKAKRHPPAALEEGQLSYQEEVAAQQRKIRSIEI